MTPHVRLVGLVGPWVDWLVHHQQRAGSYSSHSPIGVLVFSILKGQVTILKLCLVVVFLALIIP